MSNETLVQDQNGTQTESAAENGTGPYYRPDVDVVERADELLIVADAPGLTADGISINFEQNSLTVHGKVARQAAEANYLVREYGTGDYYRVFRVSDRVDASRISATYTDGVLTVHLPKVEAAKPRTIKVAAQS